MPGDWNDRLRKLLDLANAAREHQQEELRRPVNQQPIAINLGIDFGTSFTKVCFRDVGAEHSGIITLDENSLESALVPSVVAVDDKGHLRIAKQVKDSQSLLHVPYLKMRLAGLSITNTLTPTTGYDPNYRRICCALSSWFLATIIQRCQKWISVHESERVKNRQIIWSANVGVPVEHCDSVAIETFNEVFSVAWLWAQKGQLPRDVVNTVVGYEAERIVSRDYETDCHAVPEIAAAVQSFIMSREAVPGIYIYFDVGGGTTDGVAFDFINDDGERRINFYSGKVKPLGIAALLNTLGLKDRDNINPIELQRLLEKEGGNSRLAEFGEGVQLLVAKVIMEAKGKDHRDWQEDAIQTSYSERKRIGSLDPSRMRPLVIFIGGGGSKSPWYQARIGATYKDFNHHQAGIPPYKLVGIPKPSDLDMHGIPDEEFRRFAIAYGLSVPFGEGPEISLPRHFKKAEPLPPRRLKNIIDYSDSKDAYD
jgi:hypothetical protein